MHRIRKALGIDNDVGSEDEGKEVVNWVELLRLTRLLSEERTRIGIGIRKSLNHKGRSYKDKTPVFGLIEQGGKNYSEKSYLTLK